ncbi:MAG: DUF6452 family protein [Flavobacterium sp.]|jgi:hypothetical protein|uniref:DUF6452 family protein n=1 Tax=Flavobacterium sp. TaxID=239 RepID=UPI0022BDFC0A|nr:DUF6452 family protein [Flavobacterium sp.]MCZ8198463.1 DUF6452 family protein [Flavobacterium sp.]
MKKIFLLLVLFSLLGCEKDDICDENTATTPLLVIGFYSEDNPSVALSVANLTIQAEGVSEPIIFNAGGTATTKYYFNGNQVKIPLRINEPKTKYKLTINSGSDEFKNTDNLEFNYETKSVYVSRACGFKTTFTLNPTNGVIKTDSDIPEFFWIKDYEALTTNIENPNEVHLKILL